MDELSVLVGVTEISKAGPLPPKFGETEEEEDVDKGRSALLAEIGKLVKAGPPRPGLVPQSGNPDKPGRWVKPESQEGGGETSGELHSQRTTAFAEYKNLQEKWKRLNRNPSKRLETIEVGRKLSEVKERIKVLDDSLNKTSTSKTLDTISSFLARGQSKAGPPPAGLVPQSGDPEHPGRWVKPSESPKNIADQDPKEGAAEMTNDELKSARGFLERLSHEHGLSDKDRAHGFAIQDEISRREKENPNPEVDKGRSALLAEIGKLVKAGPPRPGLVPQSGNPEHPGRWVKPSETSGGRGMGPGASREGPYRPPKQQEPDFVNEGAEREGKGPKRAPGGKPDKEQNAVTERAHPKFEEGRTLARNMHIPEAREYSESVEEEKDMLRDVNSMWQAKHKEATDIVTAAEARGVISAVKGRLAELESLPDRSGAEWQRQQRRRPRQS